MRTYSQKCRANPIDLVIGGTFLLCLLACAGCTSRTERAVFDFPCGSARLQMVERVVTTFETTHRSYELVMHEADRTHTVCPVVERQPLYAPPVAAERYHCFRPAAPTAWALVVSPAQCTAPEYLRILDCLKANLGNDGQAPGWSECIGSIRYVDTESLWRCYPTASKGLTVWLSPDGTLSVVEETLTRTMTHNVGHVVEGGRRVILDMAAAERALKTRELQTTFLGLLDASRDNRGRRLADEFIIEPLLSTDYRTRYWEWSDAQDRPQEAPFDEPISTTPREVLAVFTRHQDRAMHCAADRSRRVPPACAELLAAMEAGNLAAVSNALDTASRAFGPEAPEAARTQGGDFWQFSLELYGALEQFQGWRPDLLATYARDILDTVPYDALYFGGTDAGRFVITAYRSAQRRPFHIVTQNGLADWAYVAFLRDTVQGDLWLPSQANVTAAFQQFAEDAAAGRLPAKLTAGLVQQQDGRVMVSGLEAVMTINGALAKMIVDRNGGARAMFVEESHVIPWMYPHLEPWGLIMKLHPAPMELTDAMIERDRAYWGAYEKKLRAHPDFAADRYAQEAYGKLRAAIAGLYAARGKEDAARVAYRQAMALGPTAPDAALRLAEYELSLGRRDAAREVVRAFLSAVPDHEKARELLKTIGEAPAS